MDHLIAAHDLSSCLAILLLKSSAVCRALIVIRSCSLTLGIECILLNVVLKGKAPSKID